MVHLKLKDMISLEQLIGSVSTQVPIPEEALSFIEDSRPKQDRLAQTPDSPDRTTVSSYVLLKATTKM